MTSTTKVRGPRALAYLAAALAVLVVAPGLAAAETGASITGKDDPQLCITIETPGTPGINRRFCFRLLEIGAKYIPDEAGKALLPLGFYVEFTVEKHPQGPDRLCFQLWQESNGLPGLQTTIGVIGIPPDTPRGPKVCLP